MKIIRGTEAEKLIFASSKTKNYPVYVTAGELQVGETLVIDKNDWHSMARPNLNQKTMFKRQRKTFQIRSLADGGWAITRLS